MIDRLHHVVAQLSKKEAAEWSDKNYAQALGYGAAARITSVAFLAIQAIVLALSSFVILAKIGIYALKNRTQPLYQYHYVRYAQAQQAALKMLAVGLALSAASVVASEVIYNKLKLQKTLYTYSTKYRIGESELPEQDLQNWNETTKTLKIGFESLEQLKKFNKLVFTTWENNALEANQSTDIGNPFVNQQFKKSFLEAKKIYIMEDLQALPTAQAEAVKKHQKTELHKLQTKTTPRTPDEDESLEILQHTQTPPQAAKQATTQPPTVDTKKPEEKKPQQPPVPRPGGDATPAPTGQLTQEESDLELALRIQDEENMLNDDYGLPAGRGISNFGSGIPPQLLNTVITNIAAIIVARSRGIGFRLPNAADPQLSSAMQASLVAAQTEKKVLTKTEELYAEHLLNCIKESSTDLVDQGFFGEISTDEGPYFAVLNFALYKLHSSQKQNRGMIMPNWIPPRQDLKGVTDEAVIKSITEANAKIDKTIIPLQLAIKADIKKLERTRNIDAINLLNLRLAGTCTVGEVERFTKEVEEDVKQNPQKYKHTYKGPSKKDEELTTKEAQLKLKITSEIDRQRTEFQVKKPAFEELTATIFKNIVELRGYIQRELLNKVPTDKIIAAIS